jgi:hypothetical protein
MPRIKKSKETPSLRQLYSIAKENGKRVRALGISLGRICDDIDGFLAEAAPTSPARLRKVSRRRPRGRSLTTTQVRELRRLALTSSYAQLAARFNVSERTAWQAFHAKGAYAQVR